MSTSESRSSSAVRNLRTIFETKQSSVDASSPRGRSPVGSLDKLSAISNTKKVRASFVSVEPSFIMAAVEGRGPRSAAAEGLNGLAEEIDIPAQNPDKPITGAEEGPAVLKPADPTSEHAVSGGKALKPGAESLQKSRPVVHNKPNSITTHTTPRIPSSSVKSPVAQPKTPTSGTARSDHSSAAKKVPLMKKASRSSLTAPTAASMARAGAAAEKTKSPVAPKPKPREVTKPIAVSSHLTAPTAAFRAKHEPEREASSTNLRASIGSRVKPPASTASKGPRASLAPRHRADSQSSATSAPRKHTASADSSFLERMTKPTAASQNRNQEKVEPKSPPRSRAAAPAPVSKANGPFAAQRVAKSTSAAVSARETTRSEKGAAKSVASTKAPKSQPAQPKAAEAESQIEPLKLIAETDAVGTAEEAPGAAEATTAETVIEPPAEQKLEQVLPLTEDSEGHVGAAAPAEEEPREQPPPEDEPVPETTE